MLSRRAPRPSSSSRIAAAVSAFGARTSNGSARSVATRTSSIRTASDTDSPMSASVAAAWALIVSSTRTWTIVVVAIPVPPESAEMRYILSRFGPFDYPSVRSVGLVFLPLPLEMP